MNLKAELEKRLVAAMAKAGAPEGSPALVGRSARPELGDYQVNGVMAAAKVIRTNPRQLAEKVAAAADLSDIAEKLEIAGPGFINIRLKRDWLTGQLVRMADDEHLGVDQPSPDRQQTIVVDYSGPNLAKEMHVGHLRSTIIGDALARVLEFAGQEVIRQNHVGDWGTQFGMLIAHMPKFAHLWDLRILDLEAYYVEAKKRFDSDPEFAKRAREIVVEMHRYGPDGPDAWDKSNAIVLWNNFLGATLEHCYKVYGRLGVWFTPKEYRAKLQPEGPGQVIRHEMASPEQTGIVGESFYNKDLPNVIADLQKEGLLEPSQGAKCVFLDEFKDKNGETLPLIVQKSDEGYLYATTDLAAIRYRVGVLHANRILYVTDSRQALHFRQVFAVARKAGFAPADVSLEHIAFGTMMGPDGKPFKTREGGTVKLMDLLDEAEKRALALVKDKNPDLPEDQKEVIAHIVGIGAVKYADLSQNRTSDYVFSWDKMLSLEGNTAPYMQYAYARIRSIFRKSPASLRSAEASGANQDEILIQDPAERELALWLVQFPEIVAVVADDCTPNVLCAYLYELAGAFMGFYENCPVLQSDQPTRASRLRLCGLTARTIRTGLGLLGIGTIDQM